MQLSTEDRLRAIELKLALTDMALERLCSMAIELACESNTQRARAIMERHIAEVQKAAELNHHADAAVQYITTIIQRVAGNACGSLMESKAA